jgi:hypothetical protein
VEGDPVVGTVADCRVVDTGDGECFLEVVKTRSGAEAMMEVGATVWRATAEAGVGTLVVEALLSADVREIVDAYTAQNPARTWSQSARSTGPCRLPVRSRRASTRFSQRNSSPS